MQEWVERYDGTCHGWDVVHDIAIDDTGNVYITGSTQVCGSGQDYATIKYNSAGDVVWIATYNGPLNSHDQAYAMALAKSGNIYVTGGSFGNGTERDYLTIKYNQNGDTLWTRRYNSPVYDLDEAVLIVLDDSENVYISGYSEYYLSNLSYYTIKYDSSGNQVWANRWEGTGGIAENRPHDMVMDKHGNIYITGESSNNVGNLDAFGTIKINQSGDTVWTDRYHGYSNVGLSEAYGIAIDDIGNAYVTGQSDTVSEFGGHWNIVTIKYNPSGQREWVNRITSPQFGTYGIGYDVAVDKDGNIIVVGGDGNGLCLTIKYTPAGDTVWTAQYGAPLAEGTNMVLDDENNIYITGIVNVSGGEPDIVTLKYNSQGELQWTETYDGPVNGDDEAVKIQLDNEQNVYVIGKSPGYGTGIDDFVTIKYDAVVTQAQNNPTKPNEFVLDQNYPNPFNPTTKISYAIPKAGNVKLVIYNLLGEQVATLVNEFEEAGTHSIDFNGQGINSGVYFYQLKDGSFNETKKMVLLK